MDICIYCMTNSGLYIFSEGTGLLIDGLYGRGPYQCFSPFPAELHRDMLEFKGIFSHLDALLFTHTHGDHFDLDMLYYMQSSQKKLAVYTYGYQETAMQGQYGNTLAADKVEEGHYKIEIDPFTIHLIDTVHQTGSGKEKIFDVKNCMMLLQAEGQNILLTGDAILGERETKFLSDYGRIQMVFCNPMQLARREKCKFLYKIRPERILIIHLPALADDRFSYRKLAEQECRKVDINGICPEIPQQMAWLDNRKPIWAK